MTKWLNSLQPIGALLMRLILGVSMTVYGYEKVHPVSALTTTLTTSPLSACLTG